MMRREEKGITLVSLIITIIILLILAGVSISMIAGGNGIFNRAKEARTTTEYKAAEEKVKLAIAGAKSDGNEFTVDKLKIELGNDIDVQESEFPVIVNMNGIDFTVDSNGYIISEGQITASSISRASKEILKDIYGAKVMYTPKTSTSVEWRIFNSDGNNIYLIANNYVEREVLPNCNNIDGETTDIRPNNGNDNRPRAAGFANVIQTYSTGSARIVDNRLKALNKSYFDQQYNSTENNMKSIAYMMDMDAWNTTLKDTDNKAEYVVGGPTIEMLFNSYNVRHSTEYTTRAASQIGYQIKKKDSDEWTNNGIGGMVKGDDLYVISSKEDAEAMWVASPNIYSKDTVTIVDSYGNIYGSNYGNLTVGFRPVVCLKSNVLLQINDNGVYEIK